VAAARRIILEVGVKGLTMRRLSDELGVALGATYYHVATRHDLLVLVGRSLFAEVELPGAEAGDWAARVKGAMVHVAAVVGQHDGIAAFLLANLDEVVPKELQQEMLDVLHEAGFDPHTTAVLMMALLFYVSGVSAGGQDVRSAVMLHGEDLEPLFEEGLDLLLDGARNRLNAGRRSGGRRSGWFSSD
jgi:AcrR family transcriptional regulator